MSPVLRALCLVAVLTVLPGALPFWPFDGPAGALSQAHADDDDADDDDDDDDDDDRRRSGNPSVRIQPVAPPVAGEVLGINLTRLQVEAATRLGFSVLGTQRLGALSLRIHRLQVPAGSSEVQAVALLNARVASGAFDLNHTYRPSQAAAPCDGPACAQLRAIGWPAEPVNRCALSARIGMIDTAVDAQLAGVAANSLTSRVIGGALQASDPAHGSAVAALLAGSRHEEPGLLPQSRLYAADVFVPAAPTAAALAPAHRVAEALDWLVTQRVQVINISLAGPANRLLEQAVARTLAHRVPLVVAAGNEGPRAPPAYPASYPGVIAVTAVDERLQVYRRANQGEHILLAAPGVAVHVPTRGGGGLRTGTSFAAPFVTAVVARWRASGLLQPREIEAALQRTAQDLGPPGRDPLYGWGLVRTPPDCR